MLVSIQNNPSPQGASRLAAHCRNLFIPRRAVLALLPSPACPGAAFFRSRPLPLLLLLGMLIAITLTGCSDDPAPKSAPEGTVPPNIPTPTPTPATDTLGRATGGGVPRFEISAETTAQQAFDTFTAREQSCIRDSIDSDTLDALLTESFLREDSTLTDEEFIQFFSCLDEETAEALLFALIVAGEEAKGVQVSEASLTCMQELLQDVNFAALMASGGDGPETEEFFTLAELCLERPAAYFRTPPRGSFRIPFERLDSDSVWQVVFDEFNASEQTCIRNELGEELLASELDRPLEEVFVEVLLGEAESVWDESVLECLKPVTAVSLLHSFQVALAIELGRAESSDEADQMNACLWRLLSEDDMALLAAGQFYELLELLTAGQVLEGYDAGAERCLGTTGNSRSGPPGPPPPDDTLLWQHRDDSFWTLDQAPIVVDGMVYATTRACRLHALDAGTGESQWSFDIGDETGTCARPVVEGGVVHFGEGGLDAVSGELLTAGTYPPAPSATGVWLYETDWVDFRELRAIDPASGELVWSFSPGETVPPVTVPTVSNGVVYLQLYENAYALDESSGVQIWSFPADVGSAFHVGDGAPVIGDGVWYLAADTHLYALDTATGQPLWSHDLEASLFHPVAGEGLVMVFDSRSGGRWSAFSSAGEQLWSSRSDSPPTPSSAMVVGGVLYGVSLDSYFHAIDARTGDLIWAARFCSAPGNYYSAPYAVAERVVYLCYADESGNSFGMAAYSAPVPSPQ